MGKFKGKKSIIYLIVLLLIMGLTIGFSAFQNQLFINDLELNVRLQRDVRISESVISKTSGAVTNSDNYNKNKLLGNVTFDNSSSYVLYRVNLTNYGNVKSGLLNISGDSGLNVSICDSNGNNCTSNYETAICSGSNCTLGSTKEIYVKVSSTTSGTKNIDLDFDIEPYNDITYEYFRENTSTFKKEILSNGQYEVTLSSKPEEVEIMGTGEINYNKSTGKLIISNVGSDITLHAKYKGINIVEEEYTGSNPDNYVEYNGTLYRIITKENVSDGYGNTELRIKMIKKDSIGNNVFDDSSNDYALSSLKDKLNTDYYNSLSETSQQEIDTVEWTTSYIGNVGLINSSDYTNNSSWLTQQGYTISTATNNKIMAVTSSGLIESDVNVSRGTFPVVYLIHDILIIDGEGTQSNPYILDLPDDGTQSNPTRILPRTLTVTGSNQELITVQNKTGTPYYSTSTPLNSSNYSTSGSTTIPSAKNVGDYSIYYYIPAGNNIKAKSGMVNSRINGISYTISYVKGDNITSIGATSGSCTTSGSSLSCSVTLPSITPNEGYENPKWTDGTNTYNPGATYTLSSNGKSLTATVSGKTYVATFNKNGATSVGSNTLSCTVTTGSSCSITLPSITREGYTIHGWNTNSNEHTGSTVNTPVSLSGNVTYNAITSKELTITFNKNGNKNQTVSGGSASTNDTVTQKCTMWNTDTSCKITSPNFTPVDNFTVIGYSVSSDNHTSSWNIDTEKSVSSNATYFAQSVKNAVKRTITFNKNGNTSFKYDNTTYTDNSKSFDACTIPATYNGATQGNSCSATITLPTITAHTNTPNIIGWSTGSDVRSATYTSGQSNVTITFDSNKTYYAQTSKSAVERTITFYKNGNTGFTYKGTSYTDTSKSFDACTIGVVYNGSSQPSSCSATINMPTIQAHTNTQNILGWSNGASNHTAEYSSGQSSVSITMNSNKSYYAQTSANEKNYTITFNVNGNGGSNSTKSCTINATYNGVSQASTCSVTSPDITPASGFTKIGWNSNADTHTSEWNVNTAKDVNSNKTYFAQSSKAGVTRTITFYKNNAKSFTYSGTKYTDTSKTFDACNIPTVYNGATQAGSCTVTINMPTIEVDTGYTENGWGPSASATTPTYTSGQTNASVTMNSNKQFYALRTTNSLTFANQTITKTYSTSSQTATVTAASNGTGTYTYEEKSEKNSGGTNTNYISLSGTTITIAANTPANTYTYVITATDTNSGATKDATYTITINQKKATLGLTQTSLGLTYKTAQTLDYTYDGDGTVSCQSADTSYVTCSVNTSTKKLTITPVKATSSAITVTLKAGNGTNYSAADNKTVSVTVAKFTPTVSLSAKTEAQRTFTGSAITVNTATVTLTNSETYSGTINYKYYTNNGCTTGETSTAPTFGNYWAQASITAQGNYNAAKSACVNHNIVAATPTVTLTAKSEAQRTFTGSPIVANTATVSPNGGGTITYKYYTNSACSAGETETAPTNVGTYYAKASVAAVSGKTNAASSACVNHSIVQKKATLGLTQTSLGLTYKTAQTLDYTYDGDGTVSCQSADTSYVTCSVNTSTKKLTITPVKTTSSAITVTLKAASGTNYSAADNKTVSVTVAKFTPTVSLSAKTGMIWNNNPQPANTATVTLTNGETYSGPIVYTYYTNNACNAGATTTAPTLANNYWVRATIAAQTNYNAASSGCINHSIAAANTTLTLVAKTEAQRTYTGSAIAANPASANPDGGGTIQYNYYSGSTCSGTATTTAPTNVGTYSVKASVAAVTGKTKAAESSCVNHSIVQKKATLGVSSSASLTYKTAQTLDYTYDGDGTVSCQSADTSYVTCSVNTSTKKLTITPVKATSSAVTVTLKAAAGSNYSAADNKTVSVTVAKFTPTVSLTAKSAAQRTFTGSAISANTATVTLTNSETYSGTINYKYYTNNGCTSGETSTAPTFGNYWAQASITAQGNYNAAKSACVNHNIVAATPTVTLTAKSEAQRTYTGSPIVANTATVSPNGGGTIQYNYYSGSTCSGTSTTTAPTNVGPYSVIASVTAVSGKTNEASSGCVNHSIVRASSSLSINPTSGTLTYGTNGTSTITKTGDGTLSCSSSDENVAKCSISGTTLTIIPQAVSADNKTATITVSLSQGNNYNAASNVTYSATVNRKKTTVTGTFHYNSNTTSGSFTDATKTATCTYYNDATSCTLTVPTEVSNSVGKYNSAYKGISRTTGNMTAGSLTVSANQTFYAFYSSPITIYYPNTSNAVTSNNTALYRNEYYSSATAMTTITATSQTSTTQATTITLSSIKGTFQGINSAVNSTTRYGVNDSTNVINKDTKTFYAVTTASENATFKYNSNATSGSFTDASATSSTTVTYYCTSTSAMGTTHGTTTTVPSAVSGSVGKYNSAYKGISSSSTGITNVTTFTGGQTYYAYYSSPITIYYPNSSNGISNVAIALYRNEYYSSATAMTTITATSQTSTTQATTVSLSSIKGTFQGINSAVNSTTRYGVNDSTNVINKDTKTFYAVTTASENAIIHYNSNTTNGSFTDATANAGTTITYYCTSTSAMGTSHGTTTTVPTAVSGSVGKYNSAYKGISSSSTGITNVTTFTGGQTYYAYYSSPITIYYPNTSNAVTSNNTALYRNEYYSSATAMTTITATSQTSTTQATTVSLSSIKGTFQGINSAVNSTTRYGVNDSTNVINKDTKTFYAVTTASENVTFKYNSNTTCGSATIATATSPTTITYYCSSTSAMGTSHGTTTTVPSAVSSSKGQYNSNYRTVANVNSLTAVTTFTGGQTYYAVYSGSVTNYYYGTSYTNRTLYRNEYLTSASSTTYTAKLATSNTGMSDYTTAVGPGSSVWLGLSRGQDTTTEFTSVGGAATDNQCSTTYYTVYKFNVSFAAGTGVSSVSPTSGSCNVTTNATTCNVSAPTATVQDGYIVDEWKDNATGTTFTNGEPITLSINNHTFTATAKTLRMYSCPTTAIPVYTYGSYQTSRYGDYQDECTPRTGANSECGQYISGYEETSYNYNPRCDTRYCSSYTCEPGTVYEGMTCWACTCPKYSNNTCTSYSCPTGISSYNYEYGTYQTSKYGDHQELCNDNGGEIAINTATFYYNTNTTNGSLTVATATASCQTTYGSTCSVTVPTAVRNSVGKYNGTYKGLANALNTMGTLTGTSISISDSGDYYATYTKNNVTNYYYGSSYTNRTLYRNEFFSSKTAITAVLNTTNSSASNYSTAVGPGSSVWTGLSTAADTTTEYSNVSGAANSTATTLYTVYTFNVSYAVGNKTTSIGATSGSCKVTSSNTSCTVTLPSITSNTGYHSVGWSTTNGAATGTAAGQNFTLSTNAQTLYGNSDGDTYTGTFYYWNGSAIATKTASCKVSNTAGNCAITVPTEVSGSTGKYGGTYVNVSRTLSNMSAGSLTLTENQNFYAYYSKALTIYYPSSTSARSSYSYKRNEVFTSNTAITGYINSSATAVTNVSVTSKVSGYDIVGYASAVGTNEVGTITSIEALANSSISPAYQVLNKTVTATFYYNSNTTSGSLTVATTTNTGIQHLRCTSSAAQLDYGTITVPSVVSNSVGKYNSQYKGVINAVNNMTIKDPATTQYTTYYANYSQPVTNYWYDGSAYTSRTLYRNEYFTSTSAMTNYLGTTNEAKSNVGTAVGPGNSVWTGLSTGADTTPEYATIADANNSNSTTLYTVYQFNATFAKGTNVSSVSPTSANCRVVAKASNSASSCTVTPATITPTAGYGSPTWTESGTNAILAESDPITLTVTGRTYTAKAVGNIYKIVLNNQNATTAGTTQVWYRYNSTQTINGTTCYYYNDSALTDCLASGYNITVPARTGYTYAGYYTATGGSGTNYINSSGKFINDIYKKYPSQINSSYTDTITLYAKWNDTTKPTGSISTTSTLKSATQTATLTCTDNEKVSSYYWGTSSTAGTYTDVTDAATVTVTKTVSSNGTYYLFCKDAAGNVSTSVNQVYYKYTVNNMLQNVTGSTYTSTDYTRASQGVYYAPSGTILTLTSIYTIPEHSRSGRFKGASDAAASTTAVMPTTTDRTLSANNQVVTTWFTRNTIYFRYQIQSGEIVTNGPSSSGTYEFYKNSDNYLEKKTISSGATTINVNSYRYGVTSINLYDNSSTGYFSITKSGTALVSGSEWACVSGCPSGVSAFSQATISISNTDTQLCDTTSGDCIIVLKANLYTITYKCPNSMGYSYSNYTDSINKSGSYQDQCIAKSGTNSVCGSNYACSGNEDACRNDSSVFCKITSGPHYNPDTGVYYYCGSYEEFTGYKSCSYYSCPQTRTESPVYGSCSATKYGSYQSQCQQCN